MSQYVGVRGGLVSRLAKLGLYRTVKLVGGSEERCGSAARLGMGLVLVC